MKWVRKTAISIKESDTPQPAALHQFAIYFPGRLIVVKKEPTPATVFFQFTGLVKTNEVSRHARGRRSFA